MTLYNTTFNGNGFEYCKGSTVSVNQGRIRVNGNLVATRSNKSNK